MITSNFINDKLILFFFHLFFSVFGSGPSLDPPVIGSETCIKLSDPYRVPVQIISDYPFDHGFVFSYRFEKGRFYKKNLCNRT